MPYVDLHLHTSFSDGADTPRRVVERAAQLGISAISITDHDTLGAFPEARAAAEEFGIGLLEGVEISADFQRQEIHVLAYGFGADRGALLSLLQANQEARARRNRMILDKLAALGIAVQLDGAGAAEHAAGRMHIAQALHAQGIVKSVQEAFDRYLRFGKPAYVPRINVPVLRALEAVQAAGGLSFLAHPGLNKGLRKRLPALLELPFDGIEAYHSSHSPGDVTDFLNIAASRGILVSGGSDCHGAVKGGKPDMGAVRTPVCHYEAIHARLAGQSSVTARG